MRRALTLAAIVLCCWTRHAFADSMVRVFGEGVGMVTCDTMRFRMEQDAMTDTEVYDKDTFSQWVFGYISGLNSGAADSGEPQRQMISGNEQFTAMMNYCLQHPQSQIVDAARYVYSKLPKVENDK